MRFSGREVKEESKTALVSTHSLFLFLAPGQDMVIGQAPQNGVIWLALDVLYMFFLGVTWLVVRFTLRSPLDEEWEGPGRGGQDLCSSNPS